MENKSIYEERLLGSYMLIHIYAGEVRTLKFKKLEDAQEKMRKGIEEAFDDTETPESYRECKNIEEIMKKAISDGTLWIDEYSATLTNMNDYPFEYMEEWRIVEI